MKILSTIILTLTALSAAAEQLPEKVTFNKYIRPILSQNCFACHGFDKNTREAGLRLDTYEGATTAVDGRMPIVVGNAVASEIIKRVTSKDDKFVMPPPETHKKLTKQEVALLSRWIDQGAVYEDHWSFIAPVAPNVPTEWKGKEIDYFVQKQLKSHSLTPAAKAKKWRLVRRLYLDLIGLPPSSEEMKLALEMEHDALVSKLLASPHYGEKMAVSWLDLVRYADSVGYHGDQPVSVSPYRDYVIEAFNQNMPFDRFTREQIAGDLLPNPTQAQMVATGYNRLNMTSEEGGAQAKEYLAKYAGDRVRTTSVVWMGATLGCAECHDHKFDPYTAKDFYTMAAFFADIKEKGVYSARNRDPIMRVYTKGQAAQKAALEKKLLDIQTEVASIIETPKMVEERVLWEDSFRKIVQEDKRKDDVIGDDNLRSIASELSGRWKNVTADKGPVYSGKISRKQSLNGLGHFLIKLKKFFPLRERSVIYAYVWVDEEQPAETIMLEVLCRASGGWDHRAYWGKDKISHGGLGKNNTGHLYMGELPKAGQWTRLEIPIEKIGLKPGDTIDGITFSQFKGTVYWDQVGVSNWANPQLKKLGSSLIAAIETDEASRTQAQSKMIQKSFYESSVLFEKDRQQIAGYKKELKALAESVGSTLVTKSVKPRTIRVLPRGNWMDDSGEIVEPAVPEFLGKIESDKRLTRLDLANWLIAKENPLTARVFVNRLWKQYFGVGISRVLDDVGAQGEWPAHPELLDWLALEFVNSGWDVQHMIRLITASEAYQQSSRPRPELKDVDPYNRLIASQSSFRLEAEMVRDAALSVSGLLVREVGGVSAKPYQPQKYYQHLNFPRRQYSADKDKNQWRRGVYTHWQRSFLHPMMKSFDAPSREECSADRPRSNTPLQALVLLNDPTYVEAARVFTQRVIKEGGKSFEQRLDWAFQEALSRSPREPEIEAMRELFEKHQARFSNDEAAAKEYVSVGIASKDDTIPPVEFASWMSVSRVIFNLHEMIGRY